MEVPKLTDVDAGWLRSLCGERRYDLLAKHALVVFAGHNIDQGWQITPTGRAALAAYDEERKREIEAPMRARKDGAYRERDALVCALSKAFPAHLCRHPEEHVEWDDDWRWIVCVHLPTGQATWHIHDSERSHFYHLEVGENHWDGHSTEEKYRRLAALAKEIT